MGLRPAGSQGMHACVDVQPPQRMRDLPGVVGLNSSPDHHGSSSSRIGGGSCLGSSSPQRSHRLVTRAQETYSTANVPVAMLDGSRPASHAASVLRTARRPAGQHTTEQKQNRVSAGKEESYGFTLLCLSVGPSLVQRGPGRGVGFVICERGLYKVTLVRVPMQFCEEQGATDEHDEFG